MILPLSKMIMYIINRKRRIFKPIKELKDFLEEKKELHSQGEIKLRN